MSKRKKILSIAAFGFACVIVIISIVALVSASDVLDIASGNCNTITISASYDETDKTLTAIQTVDYTNRTGVEKREIQFHIFANAYRKDAKFPPLTSGEHDKAFPNGDASYGCIDIHRVSVNGVRVAHTIDGDDENILIVPLDVSLEPSNSVNIIIEYTVFLSNSSMRLGYTDRAVNLGNFYPVPVRFEDGWKTNNFSHNGDPFYNDVFNFNVTLTKPSDYIMASSGTLVRESTSGNRRTTEIRSYAIRDWAAVLSPHFKSVSRIVNRITVNYYYLDDKDPNRSLETSIRSLQTFSQLFVDYPYKQLTVVQTDFLHGGMEYGELVYISTQITEREEIDRVIIHEVAHQWWYGIIGNDQVRTAWIDEGLAEYSTMLFYQENPDYNVTSFDYINSFRTNLSTYISLVTGIGVEVNQDMTRSLHDFATSYEYVFMVYVRGMLLFVDLERMIGQDNMLEVLRCLAHDHMFGIVTQQDIVDCFEHTTGMRLGLFFNTYLKGI